MWPGTSSRRPVAPPGRLPPSRRRRRFAGRLLGFRTEQGRQPGALRALPGEAGIGDQPVVDPQTERHRIGQTVRWQKGQAEQSERLGRGRHDLNGAPVAIEVAHGALQAATQTDTLIGQLVEELVGVALAPLLNREVGSAGAVFQRLSAELGRHLDGGTRARVQPSQLGLRAPAAQDAFLLAGDREALLEQGRALAAEDDDPQLGAHHPLRARLERELFGPRRRGQHHQQKEDRHASESR